MTTMLGEIRKSARRLLRSPGLALGADARRVPGMVLRRSFGCALFGISVGVVLAFFMTRSLESLLFQVECTDPFTLIGARALLPAIALVASWLPACRAASIDAAVALRSE